jgi:ureidoglycolate lyase
MKLLRIGALGQEKPAILDANQDLRDLSGIVDDITGAVLSDQSLDKIRALDLQTLPLLDKSERIGACVGQSGKFICIGLNYSDHAAEANMDVPTEPVVFMKATSAICGPNDALEIPRDSVKTDWELELGVIIGKEAKYIEQENALDYVAGYCVINDISERAYQHEHQGQWTKGKSCDTFGPIGPWLVTRDEIENPQKLAMSLTVNGHKYQDGNSDTMVYGIAELIAYLSRFMTLQPGDIISTGTPSGVGFGQKPQVYLKAGDKMHCSIAGLGEQRQTCI